MFKPVSALALLAVSVAYAIDVFRPRETRTYEVGQILPTPQHQVRPYTYVGPSAVPVSRN
jgi:hypothetical protein